jgi:hypothetical protein
VLLLLLLDGTDASPLFLITPADQQTHLRAIESSLSCQQQLRDLIDVKLKRYLLSAHPLR